MICTCDQCDSVFCALQLTALIKPNWCVLLYFCACLHPNRILIGGWTTVLWPATNLSILIQYVNPLQGQSGISVALKTPSEIRLGICIYKTSLLHRPDDYIGFTPSCPPTFYNKFAPMLVSTALEQEWPNASIDTSNIPLVFYFNSDFDNRHARFWMIKLTDRTVQRRSDDGKTYLLSRLRLRMHTLPIIFCKILWCLNW